MGCARGHVSNRRLEGPRRIRLLADLHGAPLRVLDEQPFQAAGRHGQVMLYLASANDDPAALEAGGVGRWQSGRPGKHPDAKPLKGFGGARVLEIIEDHDGDAYRAVYTVRFADAIYVLHVFQKKSRKKIATPKHQIEMIRARLKDAERLHAERTRKGGSRG
jgi:phage-related protein